MLKAILSCALWIVWLLPFFLFRPKNRPKAVQVAPAARVGMAFQSAGYFLVYLHKPAEWEMPRDTWRIATGCIAAGCIAAAVAWLLSRQAIRVLGNQWRVDAGLNADHALIRTGALSNRASPHLCLNALHTAGIDLLVWNVSEMACRACARRDRN